MSDNSDTSFTISTCSAIRPSIIRYEVPPPPVGVKLDRYGHIRRESDGAKTEKDHELEMRENKVESRRESKWLHMFIRWDYYSGRNRNKLRQRIKKGIPDAFRSKAWPMLILENFNSPTYQPKDIEKLLEGGDQIGYQTIEADLNRTMPQYPMFNNVKVIDSLRRILYAYSNRDPELGYTQGMSAIAGVLLLYMDESIAYDCFETIMLGNRYQWRNFYLKDFPRLKLLNKVWEIALKDRYPAVAKSFKRIDLLSIYYTPSWFLTLFINQELPPTVKFAIFDRFCEYGSRAIISFGLVIISRNKKALINQPFEKVITIIQKPCVTGTMNDWRYVLQKYDELWITEPKFKSYFKQAGVEFFP